MNRTRAALVLVPVLALASCASRSHQVVKPATDAQRAALLDTVKSLEGTWTMVDDKGQTITASVFTVSSSGSVVREVMFPGQPHEMTNVYHMDGPTLVVTHYCAVGNQPRMRAKAGSDPAVITFEPDSVTNLTSAEQYYMGGLTLTRRDPETLIARWTSYVGSEEKGSIEFVMTRKQ
ncbi:MAG: hypothetical protein KF838_15515 [Phycisphaeraceae bacterium]|nr:MAG: hypothetical protein KF838_15515 [Phycisphaeraceae bacterium]